MAVRRANYYRVLGVARTAGWRTIRSAYRRLARRFHPDLAETPEADTRFLLIQEAYETLSDPEKRRQYDRTTASLTVSNIRESSPVHSSAAENNTEFAIDALGLHVSAGWSVSFLLDDDDSD